MDWLPGTSIWLWAQARWSLNATQLPRIGCLGDSAEQLRRRLNYIRDLSSDETGTRSVAAASPTDVVP